MEDLHIRKLEKEEYKILIDIWQKAGLPYRPQGRDSREKILLEMNNPQSAFLAAVLGNDAIAVVLVTHDGRKGWINRLAVLPEFRNRGIASQLLQKAENLLREAGIGIFACLIEDWNKESMEFFSQKGYLKHEDIKYFTKRDYPEV